MITKQMEIKKNPDEFNLSFKISVAENSINVHCLNVSCETSSVYNVKLATAKFDMNLWVSFSTTSSVKSWRRSFG